MKSTLRSFSFIVLCTLAGLVQAADDAKAIVDGYMAAWNAHDADKAASFLAEDAVYFDATVGTQCRAGPELEDDQRAHRQRRRHRLSVAI